MKRKKKKANTIALTSNLGLLGRGVGFTNGVVDRQRTPNESVHGVILNLSIRSSLMVYKFIR